MKRVTTAIAVVAMAALPSFAADAPCISGGAATGMGGLPRGAMQQMMRSPQHLLMMAYHRNVASFGRALYQAARASDTVSPDVARVAVAEMKRSVEEMEKYRATAMREVQLDPQMRKMMDEHLVQLKTHLRELDELTRRDPIDSAEIRKHLDAIFESGERAGCGAMPGQMQGRSQRRGWGQGPYSCGEMMPPRAPMMRQMMQKMKEQDAELAGMVREMERAPRDRKLDLVSGIVARMVDQRAAMTAEMERMQKQMMQWRSAPVPPDMQPTDEGGDGVEMNMDDERPEPR